MTDKRERKEERKRLRVTCELHWNAGAPNHRAGHKTEEGGGGRAEMMMQPIRGGPAALRFPPSATSMATFIPQ